MSGPFDSSRACEVRHIIIPFRGPVPTEQELKKAALSWAKRRATTPPTVTVVQHQGRPHLRLVWENQP